MENHFQCSVRILYLWCPLMDFHQTFVTSSSWYTGKLIRFWIQKVEGQGPTVTKGPMGGGIWSSTLCINFKPSRFQSC